MPTLSIKTNVQALRTQENSRKVQTDLGEAIRRLSSGLRVNSAKDDAAGQAIANRFTSSIRGMSQAARNANDGISMLATAEGALDEINERLHRIRELTVQGISGSYNQDDRDAIQAEINLNLKEIDRIVEQSHFNGKYLLNGSAAELGVQIGAHDQDVLNISFGTAGFGVKTLGLEDYYISGIAGDIIDIHELTGRSVDIYLLDPRTTTKFIDFDGLTELNLTDPKFVSFQPSGALGSNGYATKALDENGDLIVYGAVKHSAWTTTVDRSSEVQISTSTDIVYFQRADAIGNHSIRNSNLEFVDGSGNALGGNPELVQHEDGSLYIKVVEAGETFYYRSSLDLKLNLYDVSSTLIGNLGTATVVDDTRISARAYSEASLGPTALSAFTSIEWQDENGDPLAGDSFRLVKAGSQYYVEVETEDTSQSPSTLTYQYFESNLEWDLATNTLKASAGAENAALIPSDVDEVTDLPGINLGDLDLFQVNGTGPYYLRSGVGADSLFEPVQVSIEISQNGDVALASTQNTGLERKAASFTLAEISAFTSVENLDLVANSVDVPPGSTLYYGRVGPHQGYYLYETVNDGTVKDEFRSAYLNLSYDSSGTIIKREAEASSLDPVRLDEDVILTGQALVDFNTPIPANVTVQYVDSTGKIFNDVLGKDADGNYILRLGNGSDSSYRTATLVQVDELEDYLISQDGDILVKTVNGTGEVIIYQKMTFESVTNAHADQTTVVITESGQEIRLRQPRDPLAAMDRALTQVDTMRGYLGAVQNRLGSAINSLRTTANNLSAARSRIIDADYATEVSSMTRSQILQQAASSVLVQANQIPQTVLSLLR